MIIAAHKLSVCSIPQSFFDVKDKEQSKQALEAARKVLFNEEKKPLDVSLECLPYVLHCFSSKNEDSVIETIVAMQLGLNEETYVKHYPNIYYRTSYLWN